VILWLNGTFGAGKTTTANLLTASLRNGRLFDAEEIGYLLRRIGGLPELGDFQHWPPWRSLVAETARQVLEYVGGTLVIPQTILVRDYWAEISTNLATSGTPVQHFVLHADTPTLQQRIDNDTESNRSWRLAHLPRYQAALPWLRQAGEIIDTTIMSPEAVAAHIREIAALQA
jgi:hypothetical protein